MRGNHDFRFPQSLEDNGIKVFGPDGYKLSEEVEARIEELIHEDSGPGPSPRLWERLSPSRRVRACT